LTGRSGGRWPTGSAGCRHRTSAAPAPPAGSSPAPDAGIGCRAAALGGQQPRHEQHGLLADGEHGGVGDRIGHSWTSVADICGRTSLLPRSCAVSPHLPAVGVSLTCQPLAATGKGSLVHDPPDGPPSARDQLGERRPEQRGPPEADPSRSIRT
jgi:hypothetical protein